MSPRICEAAGVEDAPPRRRFSPKRVLRRWAVLLPLLYLVLLLTAASCERRLLYPCTLRPTPDAMAYTRDTRRLWVEHGQGRTPADFTPGVGRSAESPGPLVVFLHGNGELIEDWAVTAGRPGGLAGYLDRGASVLAVEYRGAGSATGKATKDNITADAIALRDLGAAQPEVDPERVVLHGRSMGGGIVAAVALERPPAGIVLESTYTKVTDLTKRMLIPTFLNKDRWDIISALERYPGPVFVTHSREDGAIPFSMAERNAAAAAGPSVLVEVDHPHHELWPDELYGRALEFVTPRQ